MTTIIFCICAIGHHSDCPGNYTYRNYMSTCACSCHRKIPAVVSQPDVLREAA